MRHIAVILAGGSGNRIGGAVPKQLIKINGKAVLEHSVDAFRRVKGIDEISVVLREDLLAQVHIPDVRYVIGGTERSDSVEAALRAYADEDCYVLLHDAARPLISERIISDCLQALRQYDAVDVAVEATDTIIEVDDNNRIVATPDRAHLKQVQTPQCFRLSTITEAYRLLHEDTAHGAFTDDISVLHHYLPEVPIYVVKGDRNNIKLTYEEDVRFFQERLK